MKRRKFLAGTGAAALVAFGAPGAAAESTDGPDGGPTEQTGHCWHDCQTCLDQPTCFDCGRVCFPWIE